MPTATLPTTTARLSRARVDHPVLPATAILAALLLQTACSSPRARCGAGTSEKDGVCLATACPSTVTCGPGTKEQRGSCMPDPATAPVVVANALPAPPAGHPDVARKQVLAAMERGPGSLGWLQKPERISVKLTSQKVDADYAVVTFTGRWFRPGYDLGAGVAEPDRWFNPPCEAQFHWEARWVLQSIQCVGFRG